MANIVGSKIVITALTLTWHQPNMTNKEEVTPSSPPEPSALQINVAAADGWAAETEIATKILQTYISF